MRTLIADHPAGHVRGDEIDAALLCVLDLLRERDYDFVTPTPATHARVLARPDRRVARSLADVLGWSLPFTPDLIDAELLAALRTADAIEPGPDRTVRSRYRVSRLHRRLYLHSSYPTEARDAVFFGPDSYRFADLIADEFDRHPPEHGARVVDIGTGAGVGAIVAAGLRPDLDIVMTDINAEALRLARINARAAGVQADAVPGKGLDRVRGPLDIVLTNPPYIIDEAGRDYRDGGGMLGGQVAFDMASEALDRLSPGGRLILYTGSAIVDGADLLRRALGWLAAAKGFTMRYREVDPDMFGDELDNPAYRDVDRIAIVAAIIDAPAR